MYFYSYIHSLFPLCETKIPVSFTVYVSTKFNTAVTDSSGVNGLSKCGYTSLNLAIMPS